MVEEKVGKNCTGCSSCFNACPKHCIEMVENDEGFLYPKVDKSKCVQCGICLKKCPILNKENNSINEEIYVAYNNDDDERMNSSSGGCFVDFATEVLLEKGVVFGAGFDENLRLKHKPIIEKKDLINLQGSKYIQSEIGKSFTKVKEFLEDNKIVLFSGTPCQIAGLKSFLGKTYNNLYTISIVCHGVPSKNVFIKYLNQNYGNENVSKINFRDKTYGWANYSLNIELKNKKHIINLAKNDSFMKIFLSNVCLRESCYNCKFKDPQDVSDILIGDFWGVNNIKPELNDDKGISIVIIHTQRGKQLLKKCEDKLTIYSNINKSDLVKYNPCIKESVKRPNERDDFFKELNLLSIKELSDKYAPKQGVLKKIKNKIYSIIKRR